MADVTTVVILGSSATSLAVVRSCHGIGLEAVVVDAERGEAGLSRYARFEPVQVKSPAETLQRLLSLPLTGPAALIAESDAWLRFLQRHRGELAERYVILHPEADVLDTCLDKQRFHDWCLRERIATPRRFDLERVRNGEDVSYPLLLRPRVTCHDRSREVPKAVEVRSTEELHRALAHFDEAGVAPVVTQSLLRPSLHAHSVGLARRDDGAILSLVAERQRPTPRHCAAGTYVALEPQPAVQTFAEMIAERLDLVGIAEIEVLRDEETCELFAIEVNARPWLQFPLADRSGHHLLAWLLDRPVRHPARRRTRGVAWIDMPADLYFCLSRRRGAIWNGEISLTGYLLSLLKRHVHPRLSLTDPRPVLVSLRQALSPFAKK